MLEASDVLKKIAAEKERAKYGANANPKPTSTARNVVTVLDSDDFDDDEIFGFDDEFNVSKHQSNRKNTTKYMGDLSDGEFDDEDDANLCESLGRLKLTQSRQESLQQQFQPERHIKSTSSLFDLIGRKCSSDDLCAGSIKLRVLLQLCRRLHRAGHRTLVFSQSRLMIDIIQSALNEKGLFSVRIDGTVTGSARQGIIDKFNSGASSNAHRQQASNTNDDEENENDEEERIYSDILNPTICLLTTKACGYGITLTGADRVIIYDPSWNPAEDRQAVDRAFRIGQTRDVFVYRFIMASTVEEKMYEKQVFKDGVRILTEKGSSSSYFSSQETSELFNLGPPDSSEVYDRLPESFKFTSIPDVRGQLSRVIGYSRHDVLYDESGPKPDSSATTATATATSTNGHSKQRSKVATLVDVSEDSTGSEAYTRNGLRRLSHFSVAEESIEDDHDVDLIMNEVQLVDVRSKRRTRIKRRSTIEDVDIEDISNEFESKMNLLSSSPRLATTNGHRNVFVIDSDSDCDLDCEYLPNTIKSTRRVNISIAESETNVQTPIQANLNQEKKYIAKFSNHLGDTNPLRPGEYSNWDDDDYALSSTQPSPPPQQPKLQQQPQLLQEHKPVADEDYESPSSLYLKVTAVIGYIANVTRLSFLSPLSGGSAGAITQSPIKSLSQIQGLLQQDYEKRRIDDDYNDTDNDRQSSLTRELFIESEEVPISATDHSVLHNDNDTNPDMKEDTSVAGFNSVTTVPLSATDLEAESEAAASAVALWDTSIVYSRDLDLVESDESSQESIATTIKHISTTDSVAHDSVSVSVSEAHTPGSQVTRYSVSACDTDNDFPLLGQSGALVELRRTQQAIVSRESLIHNTIDLCSPVFKSSQWTQLPSPTPTKSPMSLSMKSPLTPLQQHTPQTRRKVLASSGMKTANASGDENDISNIENRTPCVNQNSNIKISAVSTAMKDKAIDISTPLTYSHCKYKDGSFAKKYLVKPQLASITRTPQSFRPSQPLPTPQSFLERLFTPSTASSCQSNGNANKSTEISGNRRKSSQSSQNDSKLRNKQSATKDGAKDYNDVVIDTIDPMFWL